MHQDRFEIVRQTKLDLAQWITIGLAKCANPSTSVTLARYAAAQLESAAIIPVDTKRRRPRPVRSLLRAEIQRCSSRANGNCFAVLNAVSRAMLHLLAGSSAQERNEALRDIRTTRLIQAEVQAARILFESLPGKTAA